MTQRSPREPSLSPAKAGFSGDGGNRTHERFLPSGERRQAHSPAAHKGYHTGHEPGNKGKTYKPEPLTPEEFDLLLSALPKRGIYGVRNRALLVVLYRSGIRLAEALALLPKDVGRNRKGHGIVTVLHGKGDKKRVAGIDDKALEVVDAWRDVREGLGLNGIHPLFCSAHGTALYPSYVQKRVRELAAKAGIEKRVHPHGLRHSHAHDLVLEDISLPLIQKQLGHSSLDMTARYLTGLTNAEAVEAINGRTW